MNKIRLATVRLYGCLGCQKSLPDIHERLSDLAGQVEIVHSPQADIRQYPECVDIVLVEGAIGTSKDMEHIRKIRKHTRILVAYGDCAVTANNTILQNPVEKSETPNEVYSQQDATRSKTNSYDVPELLKHALPLHYMVKVDLFVPGCPPSANTIFHALSELIAGRTPDLVSLSRFGANENHDDQ